jgi:hypothetical protein
VQHTSENGAVPGPSVLFLWTLVTSGLYSFFGHKELVLTVKRKVLEEVLPEGIQDFFQAIVHTITNEGNSFDEGTDDATLCGSTRLPHKIFIRGLGFVGGNNTTVWQVSLSCFRTCRLWNVSGYI